jgi:4-deoxy-L-threo-5-hexosulose-uronate ketol-isomerase
MLFSYRLTLQARKLYINSAPAHHEYPSKKVTKKRSGDKRTGISRGFKSQSNNKLLVNSVLPTCQLQMGMTELKPGSIWNTMPVHTHNRRMELIFI